MNLEIAMFSQRALLGLIAVGVVWVLTAMPVAADKDKDVPDKKPDLVGVITAASADARTITLEIAPQIKGEPPTRKELSFNEKTKFSYFGVDAAGESPTVGYVAQVWLVDGSQDLAAGIRLGRKDANPGKAPDFSGRIVAVSRDLKTLTLELDPKEKGDKPRRVEVKLTDNTKRSYFGVDLAGQAPTVGYVAQVWLADGSTDLAAGIHLGVKR
jgi:hypothetical protein